MTWDDLAGDWDHQPGVREYAMAAFTSLQQIAAANDVELRGARACDFGCGTGQLTEQLAPLCETVVAVDNSPRMREVLDRKAQLHDWTNVSTAVAVPAGARFDLVACSSALAFVADYGAMVTTLVQHLEPGGLFVQWDWELQPGDAHGVGFTRERIASTLAATGLHDVQVDIAFELTVDDMVMAPLVGSGVAPLPS
ncbi:MAG: class I SAM-dependent methyltransferase [Actinomycetota bacterium]